MEQDEGTVNRREFIRCAGGCACFSVSAGPIWAGTAGQIADRSGTWDVIQQSKLAEIALDWAKKGGASYADVRWCLYQNEYLEAREHRIEDSGGGFSLGYNVRVLLDGSWGYASSPLATEQEIRKVTQLALTVAKASQILQTRKFVLEEIPAYRDKWVMPMTIDPFDVPLDQKIAKILTINEAALKSGASYVTSRFDFVREQKLFVSSRGSHLEQVRVRIMPDIEVTVVDKASGRFSSCSSLVAPRGSGYDYLEKYDFLGEVKQLGEQAHHKLKARPVEPGQYDLVLDPTHLWLTIHESVGHPTELDRALGWEANFAGTTFVTTDQIGKLQYGSHLMNVVADRSQIGGLSTVGYDDDGVKAQGHEFPIIKDGVFQNFQMAMGQAQLIGQSRSNGCAFADNWTTFPIQRMPNVSLQPNPEKSSKEDLFAGIKRGIYILGNGSWSIDQQRHNFQFGGQQFYEIKNGQLAGPLRDVAYQGSTVSFWNSLDGLGDSSTYFLGGAPNCGKGQPEQSAPVSHGCPVARFRGVTVLNTGTKLSG